MIYVYAGSLYFILTAVILVIGLSQGNWLDTSNQQVLSFRKPTVYRIGIGMFSLLFVGVAIGFASMPAHGSDVFIKLFFVLVVLILGSLVAYMAGPQDVSIDLETRMCYETVGWMFHLKKRTFALTEASCVCINAGQRSYYVYLMIGGGTKKWFQVAQPTLDSEASRIAHDIGDKLHLPVKELSDEEMMRLS